MAIGMSVTGLRPVVEIMFSDFLPTAADAIIEELPKFRFMTGGQCSLPVTVRSIGGGTGRFGTQHSATGESWFMAFPGLIVATAGTPAGIYGVLRAAIRAQDPVLFFEHKGLYARKGPVSRGDQSIAEVGKAAVVRSGSDVTIVSTLLMLDRSLQAAEKLAQEGIDAEVIDLRWLRPFDLPTRRLERGEDRPARHRRGAGPRGRLGRDADLAARARGRQARGAAARRRAGRRPADPLQPGPRGRDHPERRHDRRQRARAAQLSAYRTNDTGRSLRRVPGGVLVLIKEPS